ncbi:(4Fe-4S)-binding protein [Desulfosporosinus nitroreducens]|uniref:(4Fe-4S)-binding protein n=1 Tax=Desulfosporosinus nitroreducens TaxID=2018668 RepID=A0ABT8QRA4_9FIRM|nr:(4Fe-4S)-binding protein [Desulfosporosinus nitroreducens]MCO1602617.1 (4Fe-4S)-binding protein [Desulfosporosinus nitroreducens]MCO5388206.1 (4Fe-4S)-binding protein [Desulfosporosinus sp.]MDO0823675.1 (4Fe-4S)-binding protein [Desulfosporosinus nitroreducens]
MATIKKKIRTIKINADLCNGCRTCEVVCSAGHATPRFSSNNPARARIHVITHRLENIFLPVFAGENTPAQCMGREKYVIDGKEYDECSFCKASCSARGRFIEPDSGLPLRCDMCEGEEQPLCVEWCLNKVLTLEEREEEVEEEVKLGEMELGLQSLVDKHGLEKLVDTIARMSQKS